MIPTVRDLCVPHPNVLRSDPEPDIEDIAQVIEAAGRDAEAFFERNHVTAGMRQLFELGVARLDGRSDQAVYTLTQAMGGGKTHLMVAFGLVAKTPALRTKVLDAAGVRVPTAFGAARVVAVSGRQPHDHFLWGEIARQIGKAEDFARFWRSGPEAPGERDWTDLIGDQPTLILLDELAPYLDYAQTRAVGQGTLANVVTYALANLFGAASKMPRCMVVVSNLTAAYQSASRNIAQVTANLSQELRRGAKEITPVALNSNEIFEILRRRLFVSLPPREAVDRVADAYAAAMNEAVRSRAVAKTPERYADEIHGCYPFHPRLRDLVALFRNNERFRQTRGLMRLVGRVVKDVWAEGRANDVGLIGVQHMDLNDSDMRNEVLPLSDLQEAIAKDVADGGGSHAETIDRELGSDAGTQVANIVLSASLMRGVDAKAGLTREQVVECLVAPGRSVEHFGQAFDELVKAAWYIHRGAGEVVYFAPQENITKRLQSEADRAPQPRIDEGIQRRLLEVFKPVQARVYAEALALPELGAIDLSGGRKLIALNPDSKTPPEAAEKLFGGFPQKNNFLIVTGSPTHFLNLDGAMRRLYAAEKVLRELRADDPLRAEVEDRRNGAEFEFLAQVENAFNRVWYPGRKPDRSSGLIEARLELRTAKGADGRSSLNGEAAVEQALKQVGKYEPKPEEKADQLIVRIAGNPETNVGGQLWPDGVASNALPWSDIVARARENPQFLWLPPGGLDAVKRHALTSGKWREPEPGKVRRGPFPVERTRVVATAESRQDDGTAIVSVQVFDAGKTPRVHVADGAAVTDADPTLTEFRFPTGALRLAFLAVDPGGTHPTGEAVVWRNRITLRHAVSPSADGRRVELVAAPSAAEIRYTLDASAPRDGRRYEGPFLVTPEMASGGSVIVRAFAVDGEIEAEETFRIPMAAAALPLRGGVEIGTVDGLDGGGRGGPDPDIPPTLRRWVDEGRPAELLLEFRQTSTEDFFALLDALRAASATACVNPVQVGAGSRSATVRFGSDVRVSADGLRALAEGARAAMGEADAVVTSTTKSASFPTGRDLIAFVEALRLDVGDPRETVRQDDAGAGAGRAAAE